jgi:hypothetical protein
VRLLWFDDECGGRDRYACLGFDVLCVRCGARALQVRECLFGEEFINRRCGGEMSAGRGDFASLSCTGRVVLGRGHIGGQRFR